MNCEKTVELFEMIELELNYVNDTIIFLSNAVEDGLDTIEDNYNQMSREMSGNAILPQDYDDCKNGVIPTYDDTWQLELNYIFSDTFNEHNNITSIIIQSILIKQSAILEKGLVNLSLLTHKLLVKDPTNQILPPNYKKVTHYTDALDAVKYIENHSDIKIKTSIYWEEFKLLRDLRHRLAHGNNQFVLKRNVFERYEKKFIGEILYKIKDTDDGIICKLSNSFSPLETFNKNMMHFIEKLKKDFLNDLLADEYAEFELNNIPY